MIDASTATIVAALIAGMVVFAGFLFGLHYRLGRLERNAELSEKAITDLGTDVKNLEIAVADLRVELANLSNRFTNLENEFKHLENEFKRTQEIVRAEGEATRAEIRRLADAMISHSHDDDGTIVFRIPPA